ncbi:MAG: M56 family peptidase, partial [Nonomuraea sp.]|nr:M56 family peptidase [Nonomuraea sp.]
MIAGIVLALYSVLAALFLPAALGRARWSERAPRLAIAMWQAAGVSVLASAVLGGLALAVPADVVGHGIADLFQACAAMLGAGP